MSEHTGHSADSRRHGVAGGGPAGPRVHDASASPHHHASKEHAGHDHATMVADFRFRFWISVILTIPVLALSPMIQGVLGLERTFAFPGSGYVLFSLSASTVIVATNAMLLERARNLVPSAGAAAPTISKRTGVSAAAYSGLIDTIAGLAITVLAICGLANLVSAAMAAIATITLGVALIVQAISEFAALVSKAEADSIEAKSGRSGLTAVLLAGGTGVVLGVVGLLRAEAEALISVAVICYGTASILGGSVVRRLYVLRQSQLEAVDGHRLVGRHVLEGKLISAAAALQALAGLAAIVLGVVALASPSGNLALDLSALLALGGTLAIAGGAMMAGRDLHTYK